ncbi:MAG: hypothetical protein K6E85_01995 [Lachnospiraceae bacterium]|nr:hypothetical protein [Lachnospiraceae bacterium]
MKKFFKALALVLALTLVFGTIPASAAVDADKVRTEKTLYVDGTKGFKTVDGEEVKSQLLARTTYWKLLKIKKAEAKSLEVTAESSAPEIVKVNDKSMGVRAYAIGKATIKIAVDGKVYNVAVTAKKSADTVTFGRDFEDTEKAFYAGKSYEISLPRTVNGVKLDTDERRLFVKNEKGEDASAEEVVVTADATAPRLWTVKFLKAGKYTIVGEAFQSKKYDGTTASYQAEIEVKTPELADDGIRQTAVNAFQLTFDGDANAVDNFKPQEIYYKVKDSVVPFSLLKEVKIDADDNTKVNVTMYGNFVGGTEYFVKVGEKTVSFVACGTSAKDIDRMIVKTTTVEYGDFREINYRYLNVDGIDITDVNGTLKPVFELVSNNADEVVVAGTQIYFYEKGKTATVKGSVTTDYGNEANGYQPTVKDVTASITSVDQKTAEFIDVLYSFEAVQGVATKLKNNHEFMIGDNNAGVVLNIFFKYRNAADTDFEYHTLAGEGISAVKVADENFLVVKNDSTGGSYVTVEGIREVASVPVILYKMNNEGKLYAYHVIEVAVKPARKLSTVTLTPSKNNLNREDINGDKVVDLNDDTITLTLEAKDQYGVGIAGLEGKIDLTQSKVTIDGVGKLTIDNTAWAPVENAAGKYTYKITPDKFEFSLTKFGNGTTYDDAKLVQGGSIVLSAKVNNAVSSNNTGISIADKTSVKVIALIPTLNAATLDTSIKTDTEFKGSTFSVKKSKNGFDAGVEGDVSFITKTDFTNKVKTTNTKFVYTVSFNGALIDGSEADFVTNFVAPTLKAVVASGASATASGTAIKAKAGTYLFTLYETSADAAKAGQYIFKNLGSKSVVVSDNQIQPVVSVVTDVCDTIDALRDAVGFAKKVLKVTWDGADHTDWIVGATIVRSSDQSDYIKDITVRIPDHKENCNYDIKVTVEKLFNGSKK